jgi:hypothetical protein
MSTARKTKENNAPNQKKDKKKVATREVKLRFQKKL